MRPWAPSQGDAIYINFNPQLGREQAGHRPALVLSPLSYNRTVGLVIVCPITQQAKGYPFEVPIPPGLALEGVILADHVKSLDWQLREATFVSRLPDEILHSVLERLNTLLDLETPA